MAADLKNINWKRHLNTILKVLMNTKTWGLLVLMGFTIYGIGWDTVLRPNLETLKSRDSAIAEQQKALAEKSELQKQYGVWDQQLKSLDSQMIAILPNDQPSLIALTAADDLRKLARGEERQESVLPPLEPPHNQREKVALNPTGGPTSTDLMKPDGDSTASQPQPANAGNPADGGPGGNKAGSEVPTTLLVDRFDYDLKVTGTYPALIDVLNELVVRKKLVRINKVVISKPATENNAEPDVKDQPDYPVPLDMTVSLSIYLYAADKSTASP